MKFDVCQHHRQRFANKVHADACSLDSGCSEDKDVNKLR